MNIHKFLIRSNNIYFLRHSDVFTRCSFASCIRRTHATVAETERDPTPIYFSDKVQSLLKDLTGLDLQKICRARKLQHKLKKPTYHFMTAEELEAAVKKKKEEVQRKLQMPPVMLPRKPIKDILAKDPAIQGLFDVKYVFTDISFDKSNRERFIVVREPDGTLRKASWDERDRINKTYFPVVGQNWKTPKMFEDEQLENLLDQGEYLFILDRACLQFEPDDPLYISVVEKVYDSVNKKKVHDVLRSTRHFGPFAFHLAWNSNIDNLLLDCIQRERIDCAVKTIQLLYVLHPNSKAASTVYDSSRPFDYIKSYIEADCKNKSSLELAVQHLEEIIQERLKVKESLQESVRQ